eukprot:COSAG01_NODE_27985_length_672_cov_0.837696_1_plen_172_part_10
MKSQFYDAESADAPFSAVSIISSFGLSGQIVSHAAALASSSSSLGCAAGPEELLQAEHSMADQVARQAKREQLAKLKEICAAFHASGLPEFEASLPQRSDQSRFRWRPATQTAERQKRYLDLVNKVQTIDISSLDGGGERFDWPCICVVGGQSEGKSTLLSAIVSAKMPNGS